MTDSNSKAQAPWISDCGDGTYRNPVLFADYSDPDAVRVGEDYWMTASSFSHVPGLPILHSKDLVNWTLVGHALPELVPADHFSRPRHGGGVWAPSIRHHGGEFYIYYPDPDFGLYVIKAKDPRGPWTAPVLVRGGKGLIDPCPLWDDDGSVYLIHGWAKSRSGICNLLTIHRLSADGEKTLDEGKVFIDANQMPGWKTLEGPKFYKRNGWYYVFAPAGGVRDGYQAVFRSRKVDGPYEARIVLEQGGSIVNGPHQGAWVDTPKGEHWFLHFQEVDGYGRIVHMQPMRWLEDGWVSMGVNTDAQGKGEPALRHPKPALPAQPVAVPATSDDFSGKQLGVQWQWQANPRSSWLALEGAGKGLRLFCQPQEKADSLYDAPYLLMQKLPAPVFTATTKLSFSPRAEGDRAGLVVFGYDYAWLGLEQRAQGLCLVQKTNLKAVDGAAEIEAAQVPVSSKELWLRVQVGTGARCRFSFSNDGATFQDIGVEFTATLGKWVGGKVGVFAANRAGHYAGSSASFAFFELRA